MEKTRANVKVMDRLCDDNGHIFTSQQEIMQAQTIFFRKMFGTKMCFDETKAERELSQLNIPQLKEDQTNELETDITIE